MHFQFSGHHWPDTGTGEHIRFAFLLVATFKIGTTNAEAVLPAVLLRNSSRMRGCLCISWHAVSPKPIALHVSLRFPIVDDALCLIFFVLVLLTFFLSPASVSNNYPRHSRSHTSFHFFFMIGWKERANSMPTSEDSTCAQPQVIEVVGVSIELSLSRRDFWPLRSALLVHLRTLSWWKHRFVLL
jgi:hypothetical protein